MTRARGAQLPETRGQAAKWEAVKKNALAAGLCQACAAQAAWGAQNGFASVRPPCDPCALLIAEWPSQKPGAWRVPAGGLAAPGTWAALRFTSDRRTARDVDPLEVTQ